MSKSALAGRDRVCATLVVAELHEQPLVIKLLDDSAGLSACKPLHGKVRQQCHQVQDGRAFSARLSKSLCRQHLRPQDQASGCSLLFRCRPKSIAVCAPQSRSLRQCQVLSIADDRADVSISTRMSLPRCRDDAGNASTAPIDDRPAVRPQPNRLRAAVSTGFYIQKAYREQPQVGLNLQHEEPE
jgi:hypothetical protein